MLTFLLACDDTPTSKTVDSGVPVDTSLWPDTSRTPQDDSGDADTDTDADSDTDTVADCLPVLAVGDTLSTGQGTVTITGDSRVAVEASRFNGGYIAPEWRMVSYCASEPEAALQASEADFANTLGATVYGLEFPGTGGECSVNQVCLVYEGINAQAGDALAVVAAVDNEGEQATLEVYLAEADDTPEDWGGAVYPGSQPVFAGTDAWHVALTGIMPDAGADLILCSGNNVGDNSLRATSFAVVPYDFL